MNVVADGVQNIVRESEKFDTASGSSELQPETVTGASASVSASRQLEHGHEDSEWPFKLAHKIRWNSSVVAYQKACEANGASMEEVLIVTLQYKIGIRSKSCICILLCRSSTRTYTISI